MILEVLVLKIVGLLEWLLAKIPVEVQIPPLDLSPAVGLMVRLDLGLPISETLATIQGFLFVWSAVYLFQLARAVLKHVPYIGGG